MATYKTAFAYTRSQLLDKLEEQLKAALHHHYLLSLQSLYGFTHYLLDHWTDEYQAHLIEFDDVISHIAKISRPAKIRALAAVQQRLTKQDGRMRKNAHRHFLAVFGKTVGQDASKADRWLTAANTDNTLAAFWVEIYKLAQEAVYAQ